jgi:hypothetical protein
MLFEREADPPVLRRDAGPCSISVARMPPDGLAADEDPVGQRDP